MIKLSQVIALPVRTSNQDTEIVDAHGDLLLMAADDSVDMLTIASALNKVAEQEKE